MKRRQFLSKTAKTIGAVLAMVSLSGFAILSGRKKQGDKLGIALVGLGGYATGQLGLSSEDAVYESAYSGKELSLKGLPQILHLL